MSDNREKVRLVASLLRDLARLVEEKPELASDLSLPNLGQEHPLREIETKTSKTIKDIDIDIYDLFHKGGSEMLQKRLEEYEIEGLKQIIKKHHLDRSQKARKWKTKERLVSLIVSTVATNEEKGKVFLQEESLVEESQASLNSLVNEERT